MTESFVAAVAIMALWGVARLMRGDKFQPRRAASRPPAWVPDPTAGYDVLLRAVRGELARNLVGGRLDWSRPIEEIRRDLRRVAEHMVDTANPMLNRLERERLIAEVVDGIKSPGSDG